MCEGGWQVIYFANLSVGIGIITLLRKQQMKLGTRFDLKVSLLEMCGIILLSQKLRG